MLAWIIHHTGDTVSARGIMVQDEARWFMFQLFGVFCISSHALARVLQMLVDA